MLNRQQILDLIPHQGQSCLLDCVEHCTAKTIHCIATTHLDPHNVLRHNGRLHAVCGAEYGMQAAAVHGALQDDHADGGYLAALRDVEIATARLDDPRHGSLQIQSFLESANATALLYTFRLLSAAGSLLLHGRGMVIRAPLNRIRHP